VLGVAAAELIRFRVEAGQFAGDVGQDGRRGRGGEEREGGETGIATVQELPADPAQEPAVQAARDLPEPSRPRAVSGARESGEWVRVRLRAERLEWVPSLLAWLDRPFMIEYPDALRDHVHALARRLATSADDVPGTVGRTAGPARPGPPPAPPAPPTVHEHASEPVATVEKK